jgi:hypothetical protein
VREGHLPGARFILKHRWAGHFLLGSQSEKRSETWQLGAQILWREHLDEAWDGDWLSARMIIGCDYEMARMSEMRKTACLEGAA